MRIASLTFFLAALLGGSARAELAAQPLSPLALLNRCYSHLTQRKLPPNSPYVAQVLAGTPASDVCLSVLDKATLQATGANEGEPALVAPETTDILQTLNAVHQAWFPNDDLFTSAILCSDFCVRVAEVHDATEARLHLTRAVLTPGVKFQEVVTGTAAMEALRASGARPNLSQPSEMIFSGRDRTNIAMDLVQLGSFVGLRKLSLNPNKLNATTAVNTANQDITPRIHQHFGGGVLGTQSYLLLNLGLPDEQVTADGGIRVARRWGKAVLHDFLCRDVPVIRLSDAASYVQTTVTVDTPSFRTGQSCMQCHASMDPLAGTARNLTYLVTETSGDNAIEQRLPFIHGFTATMPVQPGITDKDPNFHRRPTNGRLLYRDFRGNLVNTALTGIANLGSVLAGTDDYYVCAASRYYQYFTGINVKLTDPADPANPALTATELYHRNLVIQLGLNLKNDPNQSVRTLFKAIWDSEVYRRHSPRGTPN